MWRFSSQWALEMEYIYNRAWNIEQEGKSLKEQFSFCGDCK